MIEFVIKSAICLTIFYGFYHLFLRGIKAFHFNRYYLLFSALFAITIPWITIRVSLNLPVPSNIHEFSNITSNLIKGEEITVVPIRRVIVQDVLTFIYLMVSTILLLRFTLNIYKIIGQIRTSSKVKSPENQIVLIEKETLPYSFFKYIFVNRSDYENGKIEKGLIIHEQVHCSQYHSVDILVIEMVKIILWFNPLIWLYRKAIQLNHEFIADHKVLSTTNLSDYENALLNLVFRNNSTYLASDFNYSLTKKRLIMMNKKTIKDWIVLRKIAIVPLFLILLFTLAFTQIKEQKAADVEQTASFQEGLAIEREAAEVEQNASFQEGLALERKAAAVEQTASFQEGLALERKAAAVEQTASFQEGLANERKAVPKQKLLTQQQLADEKYISKFIRENITYPKSAIDNNVSARVYVQFIVDETGTAKDIHITSSDILDNIEGEIVIVGYKTANPPEIDSKSVKDLETEAIRVIKLLTGLTPATKDGKRVGLQYTFLINFKLG
jgi:hypothetical protein